MTIMDPDGFRNGRPTVVTWDEFLVARGLCTLIDAREAALPEPSLDVDTVARVFHSMFHGGGTDLATCLRPNEDRANASMFVNRLARLGAEKGTGQ